MELQAEKKARGVIRMSFSNTCKKIEALINGGKDLMEINALMGVLELRYEEICKKNASILDLMANEQKSTQKEHEHEQEKVDEYDYTYFRTKQIVSKLTEPSIAIDGSSRCSISGSEPQANLVCKYKLPQLKLKEFDGEIRNWLPFWSQFQRIHNDPNLDPSDKFQYLLMAMKSGTVAKQLVDSYPITGDLYPDVINALKERFGRDDLLTEYYIRELLKMIIQNTNSSNKLNISILYDNLQCHLRNLTSLGVTSENCAPILLPLVSSCLPEDVLKVWERSSATSLKVTNPDATSKDFLEDLIKFLRVEVEGSQKIAMALSGFGSFDVGSQYKNDSRKRRDPKGLQQNDVPTAAGLLTTAKNEKGGCIFCGFTHRSQDCRKAASMTLDERRGIVESKGACYCCLRVNHSAKKCKDRPKCMICKKSHFSLMCRELTSDKSGEIDSREISNKESVSVKVKSDEALASLTHSCDVLMQTLVVLVRGTGKTKRVRLLIDSASQRSYILTSLAKEMGYTSKDTELIQHSLFGGNKTGVIEHNVFTVLLSSVDDSYRCHFNVLNQDKICGLISPVAKGPWLKELSCQDIDLSDISAPTPIGILIGADIAGKLYTGNRKVLSSGLVAFETKLGWTLMGKVPDQHSKTENLAMVVTTMLTREASLTDLWTLDTLGITDPSEKHSQSEIEASTRQHFLQTVGVTEEGRYQVHLPWIADHPSLPDNYELALNRMQSTVKKLHREGYYDAYQQVLDEWVQESVIEEVPSKDLWMPCHYLPHRHVIKTSSTTPIRPVFDASARTNRSPSLNQCLEKGPNLIEKIPSVMSRFRLQKVGVVGDIRRAFLQIELYPADRNYLRFLWFSKEGELKMYRHCRVVFGVSPSPFLLEACINFLLDSTLSSIKEGSSDYPEDLITQLSGSFYVDNCVTSLESMERAAQFIQVASSVMDERKFDLRGWELTGEFSSAPTNVLGLLWNRTQDTLSVNIDSILSMEIDKITKKVILSAAHRLFDPIGITCCVALVPKLLLQRTWELGLAWDQEVPEDIAELFSDWMKDVTHLADIQVPRWIAGYNTPDSHWSLHIFSDACQTSYAATAFLRVETNGVVNVQLLAAKARVAPIGKPSKRMTIPRLELLAASIAARLYVTVRDDFGFHDVQVVFWTDASTVLAWIKRSEPWDSFVFNRIKEIRELTVGHEWKHIPGSKNPADMPSRGCSAKKLLQTRWWEGPSWLRDPSDMWPCSEVSFDELAINAERKKSVVSSMLCNVEDQGWYFRYFSQFPKLVRMIGWIYRFMKNTRIKKSERIHQDLTASEYADAERKVICLVQEDAFEDVFDPKLSSLLPFIDREGVIRLMTKVSNRDDLNVFCHPAVLPSADHPVVHRLIMDIHRSSSHAGTQIIMSILRQQYWILGGRQTIRVTLNSCIRCKRLVAKKAEAEPSPLPEARVRNAMIFEVTGVDLAGPLYVKNDHGEVKKVWVCLFTCGVYRAVHLELVSSQSTDSFLQALRRFTSRRGRPKIIYSDRGTNFVGADNAFKKLDWDAITKYGSIRKIEWRFNPPASPWWGGWWERLIGVLKTLLRKVLGKSSVNYEEMVTILCDCESVINARPLTYISQDPNDLVVLTPSMFLQDVEEVGVADLDLLDASDLNKRVEYRQKLKQALRTRFRDEYLGQLKLHNKDDKIHDLSLGEIVLVGSDDTKRILWPIGRIIELIPGNDGKIRVVRVRTAHGELVRPVQRIYPLELHFKEDDLSRNIANHLRDSVTPCDMGSSPVPVNDYPPFFGFPSEKEQSGNPADLPSDGQSEQFTRRGRLIHKPNKLNL